MYMEGDPKLVPSRTRAPVFMFLGMTRKMLVAFLEAFSRRQAARGYAA